MAAYRPILAASGTVATETVACWLLCREDLADVMVVHLLGVVVMALRCGRSVSALAALLSVGAIDFFFVLPYFSFAVAELRTALTLVVFGSSALAASQMIGRMRRTAMTAREREAEARDERLRNAILTTVSHDLLSPLSVVASAISVLIEREPSLSASQRRDYHVMIGEEIARLARLVRHVVDATALEAGAVRPRKEWMPLDEVVGGALQRAARSLGARPVQVWIEPDASVVIADAALLEQVFVNLLENAGKHTPACTPISISARRVGDGVEVAVVDAGHGVPAGLEERIFEKFERGAPAPGGMGLGLAICRGIVVAHGGRMWCEPTQGGGAAFCFVLPGGEVPHLEDAEA